MMPSIPQLLIILVIVVLLFGAKRLKSVGGDLGNAIKGFRKAMKEEKSSTDDDEKLNAQDSGRVIDGEVTSRKHDKA